MTFLICQHKQKSALLHMAHPSDFDKN